LKTSVIYKKTIALFLSFLCIVSSAVNIFAAAESSDALSDKEISWYFVPKKDNARPPYPEEASFFSKYSSYYLGPDEKVVYLTFDAGYENGNVEKIVNILAKNDVKGAFFVLKNFVECNKELVHRMTEKGHLICNHTLKHRNMAKCATEEEFAAELKAMEDLYTAVTGKALSKFYRPPEGRFNEKNLFWAEKMGYKTIFWSVAYADWDNNAQPEPDASLQKLLDRTHNGAIVLLHPTSSTNAAILDDYIKELKVRGYRFGELTELENGGVG